MKLYNNMYGHQGRQRVMAVIIIIIERTVLALLAVKYLSLPAAASAAIAIISKQRQQVSSNLGTCNLLGPYVYNVNLE